MRYPKPGFQLKLGTLLRKGSSSGDMVGTLSMCHDVLPPVSVVLCGTHTHTYIEKHTMTLATQGRAPRIVHSLPMFGRQSGQDKIHKELKEVVIALHGPSCKSTARGSKELHTLLKYSRVYYRAA